MQRSQEPKEAGTTSEAHPTFAALYGPPGFYIERLWMGERREWFLNGPAGLVPFGDVQFLHYALLLFFAHKEVDPRL